MNGDSLLDTNIVIAFQAGEPDVVARVQSSSILISSTVVGELFYGAYHSNRQMANVATVSSFCQSVTILACDYDTGRFYGVIKGSLRARGKKIPDNDIWIAAVARQFDLTLVIRDQHFGYVNDLRVESW